MHNVLITGAGKIGSLLSCLLTESSKYHVHLADIAFDGADVKRLLQQVPGIKTVALDVKDQPAINAYLQKNAIDAVVSCLPYFLNTYVAQAAKHANAHYFDLAEDTTMADVVKAIGEGANTAFVPQCGLAPGFIGIVAASLMQEFNPCFHAKLRVGAIPQRANNGLHYSLTWSTEGLINEYGNPCHGIEAGAWAVLAPLEGLETIEIDGCVYEAFNTSGGLGRLAEMYEGKVKSLNYKTIRYPGHCDKIRFLMNELQLNEDRETLKRILQHAVAKTYQDLVIIYVSVEGMLEGELVEKSYIKKLYPKTIRGIEWSAVQVCTASSICAVMDLVLKTPKNYHGLVMQEQFQLPDFLANRFGKYFA